MRLLEQNTNEEIEKYRVLLNQSLAKKYRDEELSYDKIRFIDKTVKETTYLSGYITIPQCTFKGNQYKSIGEVRFNLGKKNEVMKQLEHLGLRDKLINEIKKRINEKFNL